jgi:hypothetical protein
VRACENLSVFIHIKTNFDVYKNIVKSNWKCGMKKNDQNITKKWCEMLAHFTKNMNAVNIKCLISFCLALPGYNAPIDRIFSIINT